MSGARLSGAPSVSVSIAAHARELSFTGQDPPDTTRLSGALSGALKCVLAFFTNIFSKELGTQLATPLDPSNDAKLDLSSGTR